MPTQQRRVFDADRAFADLIREFRGRRHLTQQEVARRIGVSYQQFQKYESLKNRITVGRAFEIAQALDVPLTTLIQLVSRPEIPPIDHQVARLITTFRSIHDPSARFEVCRIRSFRSLSHR